MKKQRCGGGREKKKEGNLYIYGYDINGVYEGFVKNKKQRVKRWDGTGYPLKARNLWGNFFLGGFFGFSGAGHKKVLYISPYGMGNDAMERKIFFFFGSFSVFLVYYLFFFGVCRNGRLGIPFPRYLSM